MASTSRSRPSATTSRGPTALPPHQPLSNPLNPQAINALQTFARTYPLTPVTKRHDVAVSALSNIAADINERYGIRSLNHHRSTARRAERGVAEDEAHAAKIEKMGQDTEALTAKMEEALRAVIDRKAHTQSVETALRELATNPGGRPAATQSTLGASQFRGQKRRRQNNNNNNDDDDEEADSTSPAPETQEGPLPFFNHTLSTSTAAYAALSQRDKYASHNDYIGFRKLLHDAQHPGDDDAPPLPHPSTWFTSAAANDSDEDLQVAREKRSIRCPITLRTMKDPVSSTKCPHSFEREAIFDMLSASSLTVGTQPADALAGLGAARKEKAVKCPECAVVLRRGDLAKDEALVRKIRRMREREERDEAGEGDEDEDVDIGVGVGGRNVNRMGAGKGGGGVKVEGARSQSQRQREVSMVPATQLSGEEEEEEDSYEVVGETQLEDEEGDGVVSVEEEEEE
ncbi:MAG: hypothetical protein Q9195_008413 [Heterodermia aff. obscurata]